MIHEILTALLYDVLSKLKNHKDLFAASEGERTKILSASPRLPEAMQHYLGAVTQETFIKNVEELVSFLNDSTLTNRPKGKIFASLADFCARELAQAIDSEEVITGGACGEAIREALGRYSYQEATDSIDRFLRATASHAPTIVVQSARPIPGSVRTQIREELQKDHPHSIPVFSINTDLLGGLRVFINGTVHDYSWRSKINQLISL